VNCYKLLNSRGLNNQTLWLSDKTVMLMLAVEVASS
jgi:hypothetical protein